MSPARARLFEPRRDLWRALGVGLLLGVLAWRLSARGVVRGLLLAMAGAAIGWSYAGWRAELRLADALPGELEGRDVQMTGVIASLPQDFERGLRFVFAVEESAAPVPRRISLAWYKGYRDDELHSLPEIHAGEHW